MAKIIVNAESFATESTVSEIMTAAAAAHPNNSAEVIRDNNGKMIKVIVNLPEDVDAGGLATATAKIQGNNGVSKTSLFPIGNNSPEDFESYSEAAAYATGVKDLDGCNVFASVAAGSTVTATGGIAGKSLSIPITTPATALSLELFSHQNNIGGILSYSANFKVKLTGTPTDGDVLQFPYANLKNIILAWSAAGYSGNGPGWYRSNTSLPAVTPGIFTTETEPVFSIDILSRDFGSFAQYTWDANRISGAAGGIGSTPQFNAGAREDLQIVRVVLFRAGTVIIDDLQVLIEDGVA